MKLLRRFLRRWRTPSHSERLSAAEADLQRAIARRDTRSIHVARRQLGRVKTEILKGGPTR